MSTEDYGFEITYIEGEDGILYPDLVTIEEEPHYGKYGFMRKRFLREHYKGTYTVLVMKGNLTAHLNKIDDEARAMVETLVAQMVEERHITEQMKAEDRMGWGRQMNEIKAAAEEVVYKDIVYHYF